MKKILLTLSLLVAATNASATQANISVVDGDVIEKAEGWESK
jgi:hypothetical protein